MLQFSNSFQSSLASQQRDHPQRQLSSLASICSDQRYKDLGSVQKSGRKEKAAIVNASQTEIHLLAAHWVSFNPQHCSVTSPLPEPTRCLWP